MSTTKEIGDRSEAHAAEYLKKKGYKLLEKNYRYKRGEIDLIMQFNKTIIFVEVKSRKNAKFGYPEEFVNDKKAEMIRTTAEAYTFEEEWNGMIRFDIVSIIHNDDGSVNEIEHLEDSF